MNACGLAEIALTSYADSVVGISAECPSLGQEKQVSDKALIPPRNG